MAPRKSLRRYDVLEALQLDERMTIREICKATGIKAESQVYALLWELEKEELLYREQGARNIFLTLKGKQWVRPDGKKAIRKHKSRARSNWERGLAAMPHLSKAEQAARIERVVQKALSGEQLAGSVKPAVSFQPFEVVEHAERIGACKIG